MLRSVRRTLACGVPGANYLAASTNNDLMPQDERARNHAKRRAAKRLAEWKTKQESNPGTEKKQRKAAE